MTDTEYIRDERLAIALEAGVPPRRAQAVAECERVRAEAAETGQPWRCECGAGHRALEVRP
jgi:hypothetical protein